MTQYLVTITPIVPTVQTPFFNPLPQVYAAPQQVQILCATPGATIYYTLDGSTPTTASAVYSGPISVSSTETINALATAAGFANSAILTGGFTITPLQAASPTFGLAAGTYVGAQSVSLACVTAGAQIRYTTDGTTPNAASTLYTGPITVAINTTETINAIAFAMGLNPSQVSSATYIANYPTTATPTFTPVAGTYVGNQSVRLTCATSGAAIHYTLDGSTPTSASPLYSAPITVSASKTISAIGIAASHLNSTVGVAAYTINLAPASAPTFSPAAGVYTGVQSIALASATATAAIYYTVDGSTPTSGSTLYSGPIAVPVTTTINAIAIATGYANSAVSSATYTVNLPIAAAVTFSIPGGNYTGSQSVGLACATPGASIYFTTDGSTPTTASNVYSGPIPVSATTTITAISTAPTYAPSSPVAATFTIAALPQCAAPMFTPLSGSYANSALVSLACVTPGATIYYTIDGSTPTTASPQYTSAITITTSETFNAIAVAPGYTTSQLSTSSYTITTGSTKPLGMNMAYANVSGVLNTFPLNLFHSAGSGGSGSSNNLCNNGAWQPQVLQLVNGVYKTVQIYDYFVQLDSSGYPTSMTTTDGRTITAFTLGVFGNLNLPPGAVYYYPAGTYRFKCDGPINMTITGDCPTTTLNTTSTGTNSVTFTVTPTGQGIHFSYGIPSGVGASYPKNMSVVQSRYASAHDAGESWHPLMYAAFANMSCIRTMDFFQMASGYGGNNNDLNLSSPLTTAVVAGSTVNMQNPWLFKSGTHNVRLSNGQLIPCQFTAGSTAVVFTQAVTGQPINSGVTLANGSPTTLLVNNIKGGFLDSSSSYGPNYEILITSGPNAGLSMPIASSTPSGIALSSAFPNAFNIGTVSTGAATKTSTGPAAKDQLTGSGFPTTTTGGVSTGNWTPSPTATYYLLFTTGANAGAFEQISGNTATTISFAKSFANTINAGDQYEVCTGTQFQILNTTLPYMYYRSKNSYGLIMGWSWSTRPLMSDFTWGQFRGGPVEAAAQLANNLNCDLWFNIGHHMTSADTQSMAALLKTGAGAVTINGYTFSGVTNHTYFEMMNEVWLAGDPNSAACQAAGTAMFAPYIGPFNASFNWTPNFYYIGAFSAMRAVDIQAVYGASFSAKCTVMCGGQQGNVQTVQNAISTSFSGQGNPFLFNGGYNGVAPGSPLTAYGVTAVNVAFYWPGNPGCFDFAGDPNGAFQPFVIANLTQGSATFTQPAGTLHPAIIPGALISGLGVGTNITQAGNGNVAVTVLSITGTGPWTITMSAPATANETNASLVVDPNYILTQQSDGGVALLTALATSNPLVNGYPLYVNGKILPSTGYLGTVFNFNANLLPVLAQYGNLELLGYEGGNGFAPGNSTFPPGWGLYYPSGTNSGGVICPYYTMLLNMYEAVFRSAGSETIYGAQLAMYSSQFSLQTIFDVCGPYGPFLFHILESFMQLGDGQGNYNALSACPTSFQAMQNWTGKTYAPSG